MRNSYIALDLETTGLRPDTDRILEIGAVKVEEGEVTGTLDINEPMKLAAAYAIADLITDAERSEEYIIPNAFDPRVAESVAAAVAKAARETGVARL